jgi:hypothetical protein
MAGPLTQSRNSARLDQRRALLQHGGVALLVTVALATLSALLVAAVREGAGPLARPEFSLLTSLPLPVYPVIAVALAAALLMRNHWWLGLALFFGWIPLEDLIRKFTANDLRLYFVKDAILALAMLGALPRLKGCWRGPLGNAWLPTVGLFTFAFLMALPAGARDPKLPVLALQSRFLFVALFPVGAYLAADRRRLENALVALAVLAASVCVLGIVQAVVGPTFLNPSLEQSPFAHLTVAKTAGSVVVLRPSGPFADVSRFASMTILAVVLAIGALRLASAPARRNLCLGAGALGVIASFASASRAAFLVTVPLVAFACLVPGEGRRRPRTATALTAIFLTIAALLVGGKVGQAYRSTFEFFAATINPWSGKFDLWSRMATYVRDISAGVRAGHFIGTGTGSESLGKRYLGGAVQASGTESGWGSVATEWGVVGLAGWVAWTAAWIRRAAQATLLDKSPEGAFRAPIALYLGIYLVVLFSLGLGFFENYVANAFFWLLSGMVFSRTAVSGSMPVPRLSDG